MCSSFGKLKGKGRGAVAVSLSGLGVLGLGLWFCVHWHLLVAHYHTWGLAEAKTFEEAKPWLEALATDTQKPEACQAILGMLGEDKAKLTFWMFSYIFLGQPPPESMLPLLRGFTERLDADERLLSLWVHFLLWCNRRDLGEAIDSACDAATEEKDFQIGFLAIEQSEISEGTFHVWKAMNVAKAWFFGVRPHPGIRLASLKKAKTLEELEVACGDRQIVTWLREQKPYLRFRLDLEHFVMDMSNDAKPDPSLLSARFSVPGAPFPHWEGPVPEIPQWKD